VTRALLIAALLRLPRVALGQPAETIEYYGQDVIGSIRIVFSPAGTVLARQDYEPFGRALFTVPAMPKEGFGAQEVDDESAQGYFHARMFQYRTGRFNSADQGRIVLFLVIFLFRLGEARIFGRRDIPCATWGLGLIGLVAWIASPLTTTRVVVALVILATALWAMKLYLSGESKARDHG
jgi:hypothetical protein